MSASLARDHALPTDARGWTVHTQILMGEIAAARAELAAIDSDTCHVAGLHIASAALELAEGRPREAIEAVALVIEGPAQPLHPPWATVHALLFDAAARDRLGDSAAAEASIERALELAEPDGVVLPFVLTPVRELLERHPRHRTAHATLLSTILDMRAGSSSPRPGGHAMPLRDEPSEAELRVIRYLPSNLKAHEIAAELFVSTNTVKTHMRHIYAKLDAHSRAEAVARARELALLAPGGGRVS
jgi:LuxR family maltose regulon positive regulatory protein